MLSGAGAILETGEQKKQFICSLMICRHRPELLRKSRILQHETANTEYQINTGS